MQQTRNLLSLSFVAGAWVALAVDAAAQQAATSTPATPTDVALLRALAPLAVAGLIGGFAVSLRNPVTRPWEMVRIAALGLIVGSFVGAVLPDLALLEWWGAKYAALRGVQLLATGVAGFGAQAILGRLSDTFEHGDWWNLLRQLVRSWATRGSGDGADTPEKGP
jgi:hypothetical protein